MIDGEKVRVGVMKRYVENEVSDKETVQHGVDQMDWEVDCRDMVKYNETNC